MSPAKLIAGTLPQGITGGASQIRDSRAIDDARSVTLGIGPAFQRTWK
jgi:hypothetical protein